MRDAPVAVDVQFPQLVTVLAKGDQRGVRHPDAVANANSLQQLKLEILRLVRNLAFNAEYASAMVTAGVVAGLERLIRTPAAVGALWCIGSHVPSALSVCNNPETVAYLLTQLSSRVSYDQDTAIGLLSLLPKSLVDATAVQQAGGSKPLDGLLKRPVGDMVPHARSKLQVLKARLDGIK
jgi:hypothetical protein